MSSATRFTETGWAGLVLVPLLLGGCSDGATGSSSAADAGARVREAAGAERETQVADEAAAIDPLVEFRRCAAAEPTLECEFVRGLLVAETVGSLERLEQSGDRRGVPFALAALELTDEPTILVSACRALGAFREEPGLPAKVAPLLDSPYLEVQRVASLLLSRAPDEPLAAVGRQWLDHHGGVEVATPYEELDFPPAYAEMGFPALAGAERHTPADSDRSIGWWLPDPAEEVARRLAAAAGRPPLTYSQWADGANERYRAAIVQAAPDPSATAEMQRAMERFMADPSEANRARMDELQAGMLAPMERMEAAQRKAVERVLVPPAQVPYDQAWVVVAEERPGRVARAIFVYRQPGLERTVIQMVWDLGDYPPAWPVAADEG